MLAAQPATFLEVALEQANALGAGLERADSVSILLGADVRERVGQVITGLADRGEVGAVVMGGIILHSPSW